MRELAFKMVYGLEIQKEYDEEQLELFIEDNEIEDNHVIEYLNSIYNGIEENKESILEMISNNLKKEWTIDRISKVNLAILKIAIWPSLKWNNLLRCLK